MEKIYKQFSKSSLQILNNILVEDGKAIVTNLNVYITWNSSLKNGLYRNDLFASGVLSSDPIDEYPEIPNEKFSFYKSVSNSELQLSKKFITKNYTQEILKYIRIDKEKNILTSTDGVCLYSSDFDFSKEYLNLNSEVVDYIKSVKTEKIKIYESEKFIKLICDNFEVVTKKTTLEFPNIERVIPTKYKESTKFDKLEVIEILKQIQKLKGSNKYLKFVDNYIIYQDNTKNIKVKFNLKTELKSIQWIFSDIKLFDIKKLLVILNSIKDNIVTVKYGNENNNVCLLNDKFVIVSASKGKDDDYELKNFKLIKLEKQKAKKISQLELLKIENQELIKRVNELERLQNAKN